MWKAFIQSVSNLDSSGKVEVSYSVFIDDVLEYPQISVFASPSEITTRISEKLIELKNARADADAIQIGDMITV